MDSSTSQPAVPTLSFRTDQISRDQRFEAWRSALPIYDASLPAGHRPEDFEAVVSAWFFSDFVLTESRLTGAALRRTPAHIRSDGVDSINLFLLTAGENRGQANGRPYFVGPNQVMAYDLTQPFDGESGPTDSIAISIARPVIERMLPGPLDFHGHVLGEMPGALLTDHMRALVRHMPNLRPDDVPIVTRVTLAQAIGALSSLRNLTRIDPVQYSILVDAKRHIERHIGTAGLTPEKIAVDLGITRSSLYRSFEMLGGVSGFIQRRRLQVIRMLLADADERRPIAELAETFGFMSPAHFATAFRRLYGVSPSEFRKTKVDREKSDEAKLDPTARYRAWIRRLA